jgi:hypothetical protein
MLIQIKMKINILKLDCSNLVGKFNINDYLILKKKIYNIINLKKTILLMKYIFCQMKYIYYQMK